MKKPRSSIFACATNGEAATTSLLVEQFKKYQFSHIGVDSMIGRVPTMYSAGSMRVSDILVLGADACDTAGGKQLLKRMHHRPLVIVASSLRRETMRKVAQFGLHKHVCVVVTQRRIPRSLKLSGASRIMRVTGESSAYVAALAMTAIIRENSGYSEDATCPC